MDVVAAGERLPQLGLAGDVREEMVGAYPLDPALAVDIGVGDDWAEAKS